MTKCIIPISGGIDSTVILHYAKKCREFDQIFCLTFDYGQRHSKEMESAVKQTQIVGVKEHEVIDLNFIKSISSTSSLTNNSIDVAKTRDVLGDPQTVNYVPFRNMMLLSIACAYAETVEAGTIFHGAAQVDSQAGFWDGSIEFLEHMNKLTSLNRRNRIEIEAPLIDKSKAEIIKMGLDMGVDFKKTWTCYEGKEKACGQCTSCSSRIQGFIDNSIEDPIPYYISNIPWR